MHILVSPHPVLRQKALPVQTWDKKLAKQTEEMISILRHTTDPEGVGLAATQVGILKRFFILLLDHTPLIIINPQIVEVSSQMLSDVYKNPKKRFMEGCLSLPKLWGFVDRPFSTTIQYQDPDGKVHSEVFTDEMSSYVHHEIDHLDGILFTDRILEQGGTILTQTEHGLSPL